ncbi:MAG TPA: MFS transporter [Opitutaceae bacterium]
MRDLLRDARVQRLLLANITGSIGSGVTIIAVPWLLVQQPAGERLYGYVTLATTVALFLFMPYYGTWLDRHSRKRMLLIGELFGATATLTMALWAFASHRVESWQLMASYFCGMLYYTLHYPAKFAFVQEIIEPRHYQSLTGVMEIQGQTASLLAGALASVLVERVPLPVILLADAGTYFFSFAVQNAIPYTATHVSAAPHAGSSARPGAWAALAAGWHWLRERPRLTVFFLSTYVPFVAVMVGNYLFPIYVTHVLQASAHVFGLGEAAFATGAIAAGFLIPPLARRYGADQTVVVTMTLFLAGLALAALFPVIAVYYPALALLGLGNAGSRVARAAIVLTLVPRTVIGRVQMFFAAFDRILRTVLTFAATTVVARHSATWGFAGLALVITVALTGTVVSRRVLRSPVTPSPVPV